MVDRVLRRLARRDGKKYSSGCDFREKAVQKRVWGSFAGQFSLCSRGSSEHQTAFCRQIHVTFR